MNIFKLLWAALCWLFAKHKPLRCFEKRIIVIYFESGGGHKMTAEAIQSVLNRIGYTTHIITFNEAFPYVPWSDKIYNTWLKWGGCGRRLINSIARVMPLVTYGMKWLSYLPPVRWAINESTYQLLLKYGEPAEVISCMTGTNGLMMTSFKRVHSKLAYTVLCSDFSDPMGTWGGADYDRFITPTDVGAIQAVRQKYTNIKQIGGVMLRDIWYQSLPNKQALRTMIHFQSSDIVVGVFYGGTAPDYLYKRIITLYECGFKGVVITGGNNTLRDKLCERKMENWIIEGRVEADKLRMYMAVMNVLISKPGPGVVSEALSMQVPLLLEDINVMYQEKVVLDYVVKRGYGKAFTKWNQVTSLVKSIKLTNNVYKNTAQQDLARLYAI